MVENAIILAAGRSLQLDGKNKVLIRHPKTRKTILDYAIDAFHGKKITVVIGFGALQIMESYPDLNYVINDNWATTNNAMSLGLALNQINSPTYVVSGDMFFSPKLINEMDHAEGNLVLTHQRHNRMLTSIHCDVNRHGIVEETYLGPIRAAEHPEAMGLFKVSDMALLSQWHKQCLRYGNLYAAQTLPCQKTTALYAHDLGEHAFNEINTLADYWRLMQEDHG